MFDINSKTVEILSSRDNIRNQLVQYAKTYLELENVDIYYTSFLAYLVNVLSILTANQLYYSSSIYREFFLTEAQLEESVYNLAKWIGYTPTTAIPATCNIMLTIPLTFSDNDVNFVIPNDFTVKSNNTVYTIESQLTVNIDQVLVEQQYSEMETSGTTVRVITNKAVTIRNPQGYFYPVVLDRTNKTASVLIPFVQYEMLEFIYQVPEDLEIYQFWSVKLSFEGMYWKVVVYEKINDFTAPELLQQAESNSLYTMTSYDKKYVFNASYNKAEIFFGNGIIGKQPTPGSTIIVNLYITKGEEGRVIAGTLIEPSKLYYLTKDGKSLPIKIITTNPAPAVGGTDSPSINDIKSRAIANLRSKNRFVSEGDYTDIRNIIPNTPLDSAFPVLKRSDIKINEIMLFTKLKYQDLICPTRNICLALDSTTYDVVPAEYEVQIDGVSYETLFVMNNNHSCDASYYEYIINNIDVTPILETVGYYAKNCYIVCTSVNFKRTGKELEITLKINNIPDVITDFRCSMQTTWNDNWYDMAAEFDVDSNLVGFYYKFDDYLEIPSNQQKFRFDITGLVPGNLLVPQQSSPERHRISVYSCITTIRKDLQNFMQSTITSDSGTTYVHNVPVIRKQFFSDEKIDKHMFELLTIQDLVNNIDINSRRMLTDFINIKFTDTTGKLTNMKYNKPTKGIVKSRSLTYIPPNPNDLDSYIVSGYEHPTWLQYKDYIATYYNGYGWKFTQPFINDSVYVQDENLQQYVYTGSKWFVPIFDIPFYIETVITKDSSVILPSSTIVENVKKTLLEHFSPKFGIDVSIDRSEIIKVIRSVEGVLYCKLIKPEIDIRFTYKIPNDLEPEELLDYTPQLVAFTYDTITISVQNEE